jgi:phosphopentomutase
MMNKRVVVLVIDSFGIGEAPDAGDFGDRGANTALHICQTMPQGHWPNLKRLGLGNAAELLGHSLPGCESIPQPLGLFSVAQEISPGKDTTTGHWEMAGLPLDFQFPVYPPEYPSFPKTLIQNFLQETGLKGILGNKAASGTVIIQELGEEHQRSGMPILYTSADSVVQIAAHEETIPLEKLYEYCRIMRKLTLEAGIGRVIARPFIGEAGDYNRSKGRKDFSLPLPGPTILNHLQEQGVKTIGIGKIGDIFSHNGLSEDYPEKGNPACLNKVDEILKTPPKQDEFLFINLVDTDMIYGHRRDPLGYGQAVAAIDQSIGQWLPALREEDLLLITADHGCDPTYPGTDHTREYVPLLAYSPSITGQSRGIRQGFMDLAQTSADFFGVSPFSLGKSLLSVSSVE